MNESNKCCDNDIQGACTKYINKYYLKYFIEKLENHILMIMKIRQEHFPSEKNDREWEEFSEFIIERRYSYLSQETK